MRVCPGMDEEQSELTKAGGVWLGQIAPEGMGVPTRKTGKLLVPLLRKLGRRLLAKIAYLRKKSKQRW